MPVELSTRFIREFKKLPIETQHRVEKILALIDASREHPSPHLKRLRGLPGYWEARITSDVRVILIIEGDLYKVAAVGKHDILDNFQNN
jgi:mRNA-degrading endonuclease YafQ of YafQ-DinJ toxin-antitoxin module